MMTDRLLLIADSGSTKTDWALVDSSSTETEALIWNTQGINPFHQDEAIVQGILKKELLPQMNGNVERVGRIRFYGSGVRPELQPMMECLLHEAFPRATDIEARGDLLGAARALCGSAEGIACILGTGANSCLYDGHSIVLNTPPLGYILGDEGSGAVLGARLINALYKGTLDDGLRNAFELWSGMTMAQVIDRVYRQPMANRWLASLSPFIHEHIDAASLEVLVVDNFRVFIRRNIDAYKRKDLPLNAVGSIAWYYQEQLAKATEAEGYTIGKVMRSPIEGLIQMEKLL